MIRWRRKAQPNTLFPGMSNWEKDWGKIQHTLEALNLKNAYGNLEGSLNLRPSKTKSCPIQLEAPWLAIELGDET